MIEILSVQGNDNTVANTARVSMQFGTNWDDLPEDYTEEQRDKLINYLAKNHHTSPFRHTSITLRMNVPIFLARQIGKHQVGMSWNEVSRRYVDDTPKFFLPTAWRSRPTGSIKQGSGTVLIPEAENYANKAYTEALWAYESMLGLGVAPEQARMVLPQGMMTEVIWTGSLMAFAHVYKLRIDGHAQVEAQDFAKELGEGIAPHFPVSWKALVGDVNDK